MKKDFFAVLFFSIAFVAGAQQPAPVIPVKADDITYLYGARASKQEGNVSKRNGDFMSFKGPATLTWNIEVNTPGLYEINLNHSVKPTAEGKEINITSGINAINYNLVQTNGVWGPGSYEKILLNGSWQLDKGPQVITLTIPASVQDINGFNFRCLELIPVAAKAALSADQQKAKKSRANTEWLNKAGYGLMFHWTSQTVNKEGTKKPYAQAVDEFDLNAFADMVDSTGARYVLFTIGHAEAWCPAPLKSWERYHPGHTTKRDLIAEMAAALDAKGIKLMCYFPTHIVAKTGKATAEEFTRINTEVMTEFGKRYGKKVAGYWFDGWYQSYQQYPDFSFKDFFNVCKEGYRNRIIALNSWIYPAVTEWQEYWAGETSSPVELPVNGTLDRGPGKGLRYQSLLTMEPYWVQERASKPDPKFKPEQLSDYIQKCMDNGGAVTINIGIYLDGTMGTKALEVMKEVKKRIRKK